MTAADEPFLASIGDQIRLGDDHFFVNYSGRLYCVCNFISPHDRANVTQHQHDLAVYEHAKEHNLFADGFEPEEDQ